MYIFVHSDGQQFNQYQQNKHVVPLQGLQQTVNQRKVIYFEVSQGKIIQHVRKLSRHRTKTEN